VSPRASFRLLPGSCITAHPDIAAALAAFGPGATIGQLAATIKERTA
jgi:hypothetical protein